MSGLDFSDDNRDSYWDQRASLIQQLSDRLGPDHDEEIVGDAGVFMDWTVNYSDGDLSRYSIDDVEEYLLGWCPRKVSTDPAGYLPLLDGAKQWVTHLGVTGQWTGGAIQPVLRYFDRIVPEFLEAMSNPANFGMAKGMFMGPALSGADLDLGDQASIDAAMSAFNALPFDARRALIDEFMDEGDPEGDPLGAMFAGMLDDAPPMVDLPAVPPIDLKVAAAQAANAPLVVQLSAVGEYLGSKGIKLTAVGNPKLVDAKALRDLFDTTDLWDLPAGDGTTKPVRGADQLPQLQYLLEVAEAVGAIDSDGQKMTAGSDWETIEPLERCHLLLDAVLAIGATQRASLYSPGPFFDALDGTLGVGVLHLVMPAFIDGQIAYEDMFERALVIARQELAPQFPSIVANDRFPMTLDRELTKCLDALQRCGVVTRTSFELTPEGPSGRMTASDATTPSGATVVMGDLGRELLAPLLPAMGYQSHELADLTSCSANDAAHVLMDVPDSHPAEVWAQWLPGTDPADKVDQLIDALADAENPYQRISLSALMSEAPDDARRRVETMIDLPVAAYALMSIDRSTSLLGVPGWNEPVDAEAADLDTDPDAAEGQGAYLDTAEYLGEDSAPAPTLMNLTDGRSVAEAISDLDLGRSLLPLVDLFWVQMIEDPDALIEISHQVGEPGSSGFVELLNDLWRVPGYQTAELLEFLGSDHPDKAVAKAARKALFRHRNSVHGEGR